jgi:hypothetical protein
VQEEATKLSKRAKRRAAGEGSEEETGAEAVAEDATEGKTSEGDTEAGDEDAAGADAADAASPNRQARRTAASKARARRKREREAATAIGLDAGEMVDDALVRFTDKVGRLLRRHGNALQWVFGLGVIAWLGFQVYQWRRSTVNAEVSDLLFQGVEAEHGRIGDPSEQGKPNANGIIDPTPIFETDAARLQAAADKYAAAANEKPGQVVSGFASVARAGILLEQGKLDEAKAGFDQVAGSEGAKLSPELRGGAIEGRALVLEAKSDLPGALAAFEELAGVPGFENRALYQQARVKQVQGDVEASKKLLTTLFKNLGAPRAATLGGLPDRPEFLRQRATQLAAVVDPFEKDVKVPKPPMGADAVQQMLEQLKEQGVVTAPTPAP